MAQAIISLGSNIDPEANIAKARERLKQDFKVLAESVFVTTRAVGCAHQPDFLNGAVLIETDLGLEPLKSRLKELERSLGRREEQHGFQPRTIDLDVVVFNGAVIDKDFYRRDFLQQSVLELAPELKVKLKCSVT